MASLKNLARRSVNSFGLGLHSFDYFGGKILFDDASLFNLEDSSNLDKTIRSVVKEGMTFVDVGAHVGYYTLIAAKLVGPTGRVFAFEPNPYNFKILKRNVARNRYTNVTTVNKAVSNAEGIADFTIADSSDSGSLFEDVVKKKVEAVKVSVISLDHFFKGQKLTEGPDVLKIDAEGADPLVLEGAIQTIRTRADIKIVMEINPRALRKSGNDPYDLLSRVRYLGLKIQVVNLRSKSKAGHENKSSIEYILQSLDQGGFVDVLLER